jgi:hypothetical protein
MAKPIRTATAAGTSPAATIGTNPARARTSSTPTAPGTLQSSLGRKWAAENIYLVGVLELVSLHMQPGRGGVRDEITVCRTR